MHTLDEMLNAPIALFDRRWRGTRPWSRLLHEAAHEGGPFEMTDQRYEESLHKLPVISFLKLVGIVATAITPLIVLVLFLVGGMIRSALEQQWRTGFAEADRRYVASPLYEERYSALVRMDAELKARQDAAEQHRNKMDLQLQQIQITLEQIKVAQQTKGGTR